MSFGAPTCRMRPSLITAMREAMVIASSWSCVTITQVTPTSLMMLTSSTWVSSRSFHVGIQLADLPFAGVRDLEREAVGRDLDLDLVVVDQAQGVPAGGQRRAGLA